MAASAGSELVGARVSKTDSRVRQDLTRPTAYLLSSDLAGDSHFLNLKSRRKNALQDIGKGDDPAYSVVVHDDGQLHARLSHAGERLVNRGLRIENEGGSDYIDRRLRIRQ